MPRVVSPSSEIFILAQKGHIQGIQPNARLVEHLSVGHRFGKTLNPGQNAFHFAAETGSIESLRTLLVAAANVTQHPHTGEKRTSHDLAADLKEDSSTTAFCEFLIEKRDYKGRTALHFATRMNQFEHTQLLLLYNANVDSPDSALGRTPLLMAIYWNHHRIIKLLIDAGASIDVVDTNGMTILHYAAKFGDAETLHILGNVDYHLISSEIRDAQGLTPAEVFQEVRPKVLREDERRLQHAHRLFEVILARTRRPNRSGELDAPTEDVFYDALSSCVASLSSSIESLLGIDRERVPDSEV
ncbi:ankyrin repeat-containing domain protein [Lophiotrema nucula]|uniref:Ankyrin repeat-containing domain protein n=1 Tax=Lophiotrema nucula TaxID=690887 RepID=A0A6A5ZV22_9PLEO|nr:ankyrin repeat-containing domain protein [Lophiotrema nucula]